MAVTELSIDYKVFLENKCGQLTKLFWKGRLMGVDMPYDIKIQHKIPVINDVVAV